MQEKLFLPQSGDITFPFNHNVNFSTCSSFIHSGLLVPESSFVWNNVRHCFLLCAHIHLAQGKLGFVLYDLGRLKLLLSSD